MNASQQAAFVAAVAASGVYAVARRTALREAPALSARFARPVWLKREDQQACFSFKVRGAFHCLAHLPVALRGRGVVAASAGNHAQGVALAARHFGVPATIVMPRTAPAIKVAAVHGLGAEVVLAGERFADADDTARRLAAERGLALVHAFDDPRVIEGQATVAAEILQQHPGHLEAVFVPVGGGGLLAGVGAYVKAVRPDVRVIGVEPVGSDAMYRALAAGVPVPVHDLDVFADGVAVREVGRHTLALAQATVDEVVRVTRAQICDAMRDVFNDTRGVVEPAGALAVAGLALYAGRSASPGACVAILTGANLDFDLLGEVARESAAVTS
ncbi:MAG: pyridoxal-phosphate dependent enzyme [Acidobacteriota bacterium]